MQHHALGRSGLQVPVLGLGSWISLADPASPPAATVVRAALDAGIWLLDTADIYDNGRAEELLGEALVGVPRHKLVLATKAFWPMSDHPNDRGLSRKHLLESVHGSLRRLRTDYLDLFQCHRFDPEVPLEETVRAIGDLIRQGKVLYWGTSEWSALQIAEAYRIARENHLVPPLMEQPQYNMLHRERVEREYAPLYAEHGLGTTIWSPLASGLLTGKYSGAVLDDTRSTLPELQWLRSHFEGNDAEQQIATVQRLEREVARELGCSMPQLAIAWCATNPHVSTVITGASRAEQVRENMKALAVVPQLTAEVIERIDAILGNRPEPEVDWRAR